MDTIGPTTFIVAFGYQYVSADFNFLRVEEEQAGSTPPPPSALDFHPNLFVRLFV